MYYVLSDYAASVSPTASEKARLSGMNNNHRMKNGKHAHTWPSVGSVRNSWSACGPGIQGEVSHECKIQNGNMIHEELLRGYRARVNELQDTSGGRLPCKLGRRMRRWKTSYGM